eukprot:8518016-Pyramimonas_sp.AAC.1
MAELSGKIGLVVWRPHFVSEAAVAMSVVGATHALTIVRFRLKGSEGNPAAVLGFAAMTRRAAPHPLQTKITQAEQTCWDEPFAGEAIETIHGPCPIYSFPVRPLRRPARAVLRLLPQLRSELQVPDRSSVPGMARPVRRHQI